MNRFPKELVQELAYQKWEQAGRPVSDGQDFWQAAEQEMLEHPKVRHWLPSEKYWMKGFGVRNKRCLGTALQAVEVILTRRSSQKYFESVVGVVQIAILKLFPERVVGQSIVTVVFFNDDPDTTFQDVVAVIEEAKV